MNSHIIYSHLIKKTNRRKFVIDLVEALCATHPDAQPPVGPAGAAPLARHRLIRLEGNKESGCFVCSTPAQRKREGVLCAALQVFCVQHSSTKEKNKALVPSMPSWVP